MFLQKFRFTDITFYLVELWLHALATGEIVLASWDGGKWGWWGEGWGEGICVATLKEIISKTEFVFKNVCRKKTSISQLD